MKNKKKLMLLVSIILILIILLLVVVMMTKNNNKEDYQVEEEVPPPTVTITEVSEEESDIKTMTDFNKTTWNNFLNDSIIYLNPNFTENDMVNFAILYYVNSASENKNQEVPVDEVNNIISTMFGINDISYSNVDCGYKYNATNNTFEYIFTEKNVGKKLFIKEVSEDAENSYTLIIDLVNIPSNADNNMSEYTEEHVEDTYKLVYQNNIIVSYSKI